MPAMGPGVPAHVPPPVTAGASDAQRQARYNYLVGRLRARQITMEEATELFGLMQVMLRASQQAVRVQPIPPPPRDATAPRPAERGPAAPAAADDLFLVGLLAMGAGAGLLAAMAQRLAAAAPPGAPPAKGASSRRDA